MTRVDAAALSTIARRAAARARAASIHRGGLLLVVAAFVTIVMSYGGFIPYWDANAYWDCITTGVEKAPFNPLNFRCDGHPSIVYLTLLAIPQYIAPWNPSLSYAINALLGAASIVAFHALVGVLFPKRPAGEYVLVTALYAFAPLFLSHAIFLNVDYGSTAFFVLFLYCFFTGRMWLASACAVAAMFSKESGVAACAGAVLAWTIAFVVRAPMPWSRRGAALRPLLPLLSIPIAVIVYIAAMKVQRPDLDWMHAVSPVHILNESRFDTVLNTNLADATIRSFLANIFVLNFQWLLTAMLVAAACVAVVRTPDSGEPRPTPAGTGLFLSLLLVQLVYLTTRFRIANNARYVLVTSPVLVLAFYYAMLTVVGSAALRRLMLATAAALVFLSNFRTFDPVSKQVFGTFAFGSHAILDMPSLIGGLRLDATLYNLESLQYHYLLSDVMRDLRPAPRTVFFMGNARYAFPPRVDSVTYGLTVDPARELPLSILSLDTDVRREVLGKHVAGDGARFFYLAFANADNLQLGMLRREYPEIGAKRYDRHGYTLDVYTFRYTATAGTRSP